MNRFFKPDYKLVQSIIKYANGRLIIDLGCGPEALLIQDLLKEGAMSVVGCDMFLDYMPVMLNCRKINPAASVHLLPTEISENFKILKAVASHPKGALFLLCRPCHHPDLIDGAIEVSGNSEILYIGLEENVEDDLYDYQYETLELEGTSEDNEIILKIIK